MAKYDYDVIVFKILTYLQRQLKNKYDDETYLYPLTNEFPINEDYFLLVLEISHTRGGDPVEYEYLLNTATRAKIIKLKKENDMNVIVMEVLGNEHQR